MLQQARIPFLGSFQFHASWARLTLQTTRHFHTRHCPLFQQKTQNANFLAKPGQELQSTFTVSHRQVRWFNKIYTRTGDKGTSMTFTGVRKPKDYTVFNALGTIDELSSSLGWAAEYCKDIDTVGTALEEKLQMIQCLLQDVGSNVATPISSAREAHLNRVQFNAKFVAELESWIDEMDEELPPLKNFILPRGNKAACCLHYSRAVCRRAERNMAPLVRDEEIDPETMKFINRLSDFLFTAARYANLKDGREEIVYQRVGDSIKDLNVKSQKKLPKED